ncbi:HTH-type transcriptional regulator SgrR [Sodalis praecaptivus]
MASPRLQQQFIRLWQSCQGESRDTTLSELALQLNCSRRHVRSLLKSMQHMGWLSWHSQPGRSKRSRLDFHYTGLGLQQQRASELLEQDRIDQLVQLVGIARASEACCFPTWVAVSVKGNISCGCFTTVR